MITTSALCGNGFDMEGLLKASAEGFRDLIAFAGDGEAMEEGYCRLIFCPSWPALEPAIQEIAQEEAGWPGQARP